MFLKYNIFKAFQLIEDFVRKYISYYIYIFFTTNGFGGTCRFISIQHSGSMLQYGTVTSPVIILIRFLLSFRLSAVSALDGKCKRSIHQARQPQTGNFVMPNEDSGGVNVLEDTCLVVASTLLLSRIPLCPSIHHCHLFMVGQCQQALNFELI